MDPSGSSQSPKSNGPRALSREEIRQRQLHGSSSSTDINATRAARRPVNGKNANVDITKTKAYKTASRRWISTIVALPILFYTSYELYERTYGSKTQKKLINVDDDSRKA